MVGGVDLGGGDVEGELVKVARDTREQAGLILRHHHHGKSIMIAFVVCAAEFSQGPHANQRRFGRGVCIQYQRVPRHFARIEALEIAVPDVRPQWRPGVHAFALRVLCKRLGAFVLNPVLVGDGIAVQQLARGMKKLLKQLCLPRVPHMRAGAAHVGNSEQIQGSEVTFVAHALCKMRDDFGVGQILFLRGCRHLQMHFHQPGDEVGIAL